ncbi:MAG: hypothetical protein JW725_03410, partial [Candidatus Babeliaceae bacterium]|nr:hypothetical protein [Candidatus Babeliaceae bacterium]
PPEPKVAGSNPASPFNYFKDLAGNGKSFFFSIFNFPTLFPTDLIKIEVHEGSSPEAIEAFARNF